MSIALYQLRELRDALDGKLQESGGELTPELEAELSALDVASDEKIERVALYIREQTAEAAAIETEATRLQDRANAKLNAAKSLKAYLQREMDRLGKEKVNGLLITVALQKNPPSVKGDIAPETLQSWWAAPGDQRAGFIRYTPESFALDRRVVLDAHKQGMTIPEGLTIEQTTSIRIR